MKITICGSMYFAEKIKELEMALKKRGHEAVIPYAITNHNINSYEDAQKLRDSKGYITAKKPKMIRRHFEEIEDSDAILVVNQEKGGIPNYMGGATFAEMMFAFYMRKKIFMLNPIPDHEKLKMMQDEIRAVKPVILNGNLEEIV